MNPSPNDLAERIWNYLRLDHKLVESDCILVLGSHDTRVAERGAELFREGWAPWLVCSGGLGALTAGLWDRPEAEVFAEIAIERGVPSERILTESKSTNTGENLRFTRELLKSQHLDFKSFIVVQKPYMERRAYAAIKKQWPGIKLVVTSPPLTYQDYPNKQISRDQLIGVMVGDLQRIKLYAEARFQIEQAIPDNVWAAYEQLVRFGYNQRVIPTD